ncbi:thioesterase domain-containing protein [Rhodococcus sp. G-MC3]|uniref:thioesterase domain-containing protein n=1 Tax=Rhodococcus sp. G-MC3 TaxID=3046209 RepID=UPI0024BAF498|nr:thioesterase domain-containing protein [Rhodococcus sp. G-MC3]MDJ0393591.1 thioesterase domain-containing protein [Rhodococcus sp. G-MC3]
MTVINDYSHLTYDDVADRKTTEYSTEPIQAILPIRPTGTEAPVFCIHPIDGLASCYTALAAHIGAEHPVYGLQTPGDRPVSLTALATHYADEILAIRSSGPLHLLGLSFGGLLAHAVAVVLQGRGVAVRSLTILDSEPMQSSSVESSASLLAGMGDDIDRSRAEELLAIATHNEALASKHFPGVYVGEAIVVSTDGSDIGPAWHPFVSGEVTKYLVPDATSFELVGPLVNKYI